jgi:hypothetical protein
MRLLIGLLLLVGCAQKKQCYLDMTHLFKCDIVYIKINTYCKIGNEEIHGVPLYCIKVEK